MAILVRGDVSALRYALLVAHLRPGVRLMVTMFDRTLGEELQRAVPTCTVTSPADIAVPAVIGACLGQEELAVYGHAGAARAVRDTAGAPSSWSVRRSLVAPPVRPERGRSSGPRTMRHGSCSAVCSGSP